MTVVSNDGPSCRTCPYWLRMANAGIGHCRCNPPIPISGSTADDFGETRWPSTYATEWCGEHPLSKDCSALSKLNPEKQDAKEAPIQTTPYTGMTPEHLAQIFEDWKPAWEITHAEYHHSDGKLSAIWKPTSHFVPKIRAGTPAIDTSIPVIAITFRTPGGGTAERAIPFSKALIAEVTRTRLPDFFREFVREEVSAWINCQITANR